jgi:PAS domain S-box-containing protein
LIDVNEAWLNLYKCEDRNKIMGKHCSVTRNKEHVGQLNELVEKVMTGNPVRGVYTERKCFDGSSGKHILSMNPTYEEDKIIGVEGFIIDISDIEDVREQMYHSVRNSEAGYYRLDMKGYYSDVNDAWMRMHKYEDSKNIIGRHYSVTRSESEIHRADEIFNAVLQGDSFTGEIVTGRCTDGTETKHILSANPVYDCDKIIGMEGFILDISGLNLS